MLAGTTVAILSVIRRVLCGVFYFIRHTSWAAAKTLIGRGVFIFIYSGLVGYNICIFKEGFMSYKDLKILEIFAQVVSNDLFKVFIRFKYLGASKKTNSNMKQPTIIFKSVGTDAPNTH